MKLAVVKIGSSVGVILPDEILSRLGVAPGDEILFRETKDGYLLTSSHSTDALAAVDAILRDDSDILKALRD